MARKKICKETTQGVAGALLCELRWDREEQRSFVTGSLRVPRCNPVAVLLSGCLEKRMSRRERVERKCFLAVRAKFPLEDTEGDQPEDDEESCQHDEIEPV